MYPALKNKSVLYIEDEESVLKNITELLSGFFHVFHTALNAEEAYEILNTHTIDILFVDIELPGISGIEFIKSIRKTDKDLPIIIISAYTKTDYLLESISLKLDQYIVKPLNSKKINKILTSLNTVFLDADVFEIIDGVWIHKNNSTITFDNAEYDLTHKELEILKILSHKKFISYDEIDALWEDEVPTANAIRSCIKHLRKKLPEDMLKNRNSFGYII